MKHPMRAKYLTYGRRRDPQEISQILGKVIERASVDIDVRQADLVGRWGEVAPTDWVDSAVPIGIKEGTLLVEVETGTAGSLLKYQIQPLLEAISDAFGDDLVTSVRLRVSR